MTQARSQPDYFRIKMGKKSVWLYVPDSISHHSSATYQPSWYVLIINVYDGCTKLYKHNHGWRHSHGAALTALGYCENRERVPFLAPYSRFPISCDTLQTFSCPLINRDPNYPINLQIRTMADNLAVKPPLLFMGNKKQWGVRFPVPASRYQLSKPK